MGKSRGKKINRTNIKGVSSEWRKEREREKET
jgi:hypothetical protein